MTFGLIAFTCSLVRQAFSQGIQSSSAEARPHPLHPAHEYPEVATLGRRTGSWRPGSGGSLEDQRQCWIRAGLYPVLDAFTRHEGIRRQTFFGLQQRHLEPGVGALARVIPGDLPLRLDRARWHCGGFRFHRLSVPSSIARVRSLGSAGAWLS
jgi:hypothetical protein